MRDNKELVTCLFQEADGSFKESNDYGNRKEEFVFKLGVPSTTIIVGAETKVRDLRQCQMVTTLRLGISASTSEW